MTFLRASLLPAAALLLGTAPIAPTTPSATLPTISINENRVAAGRLAKGVLDLRLDVREGEWHPYGPKGTAVNVLAFGELGKPLQTPGPLIRVKVGTHIRVHVTNTATGTLVVHGLADRRRAAMDTLVVPPGATRETSFIADEAGTFFYWGTTTGVGFDDRFFEDAQLNGALIVDPVAAPPRPDRVFVVQFFVPQKDALGQPDFTNALLTFNGVPWPFTERLTYAQGDSVHWRFVNASADVHPLHLHGFYFRVTARGDLQQDTVYRATQERMGVTEYMREATTADLSWLADRPGGWVFHCHLNFHVLPNPTLGAGMLTAEEMGKKLFSAPEITGGHADHDAEKHAETGMGGLVLAMTVTPKAEWRPYSGPRERLRLYINTDSQPADTARRFGYALARGDDAPAENAIQWPGPPIVLRRGQPTTITVINRATEPSQVHWHGIELDSYYDGVAGLSRNGANVSPMILPRDSFEVTMTPPRAGSFMYHTHINDLRQQSHGLYGPIIVLEPGETWDPTTDLIFQAGTDPALRPILNGSAAPSALTLKVGTAYRVRLMNVTLDIPNNQYWLTNASGAFPLWTAIAKDGFDLPAGQRSTRRARQAVSIGETFDFRLTFPAPGEYELQGRFGTGEIYARQVIHVVK